MTYKETIDYINDLETSGLVPDHGNSVELMKRLGSPQEDLPVIHVAGTNGKGSTIAFMKAIYQSAGYKVGTFTSPHILSPLELVEVNGCQMSEAAFAGAITKAKTAADTMVGHGLSHPTAFEIMTAASLLVLSESKPDVAIIEVGMGGRYDATNVFTKPLMTVITRIDYDHQAYLGDTLEEIAWHKGGIIRPEVPTAIAPNSIEVIRAISEIVRMTGHKLYLMDEGFISEKVLMTTGYSKLFHLKSNFFNYKALRSSMLGRHQVHNLSTALLVIYQLRKTLPVTEAQIKEGVTAAHWHCRGDLVSKDPLIMIDGGHNVNAVQAMKEVLDTHFPQHRIITVLGLLADKDIKGIADEVNRFSSQTILTKPLSERAAEPADIGSFFNGARVESNYKDAIKKALSQTDDKTLVLILGSLYLAYPAAEFIEEKLGDRH